MLDKNFHVQDTFYQSLLEVLTFLTFLTKKETLVFKELFQIAKGKVYNDIKNNKQIDCSISPSIIYFSRSLNISRETVKRLNKKMILFFQDYIKVERQKFTNSNLKGFRSRNKYTFSLNIFLALFLLQYNGFLKNKKTVHNSLIKLSEDQGLMTSYEQWFTKKCSHSSLKNEPTINIIINLIKKNIVPKEKIVPVQRTTIKYEDIIPENKVFNLNDKEIKILMNEYSLKVLRLAYRDASWYLHKNNHINNNFHFILSRAKENERYINSSKYQNRYAIAV